MIINPSLIYEHSGATFGTIQRWAFVGKFEFNVESHIIMTRCECRRDKLFYKPEAIDMIVKPPLPPVALEPELFNKGKPNEFILWHGLCEHCRTMYWSCENFNWVELLTDLDTARMILSALPIQHCRSGSEKFGRITIDPGTRLWFRDGKLERAEGTNDPNQGQS